MLTLRASAPQEIILFTTTGINLSLRAVNGPEQSMRGLSSADAGKIVAMLLVGQLGRAGGIALAGAATLSSQPPHRRTPAYFSRWFLSTWICQMPKATVQATLGGLPYAFHLIAGADGLQRALFIQQGSAFSVLFMATIGVVLTSFVGRPIAVQLGALDRVADERRLHKKGSDLSEASSSQRAMLEWGASPRGEDVAGDAFEEEGAMAPGEEVTLELRVAAHRAEEEAA